MQNAAMQWAGMQKSLLNELRIRVREAEASMLAGKRRKAEKER